MTWGITIKHTKPEGTIWPQEFLDQTTDPLYDTIKVGRMRMQTDLMEGGSTRGLKNRYRYDESNPNIRYQDWILPDFEVLSTLDVNADIEKVRTVYAVALGSYSDSLVPNYKEISLDPSYSATFLGQPIANSRFGSPVIQLHTWAGMYAIDNGQVSEIYAIGDFDF